MTTLHLGKKLGAAAIIALGTMASANAIVLDTFDYQLDIEVDGTTTNATASETTLLGFDALYNLTYSTPGDFSSSASADTVNTIGISDGELAYASNGSVASVLSVQYTDLNAAPGTFLDLVEIDNSIIYFDLEAVDLSFNLDMALTWFNGTNLETTVYSTLLDSSQITAPTRVEYDFANWVGADFSNVASFTTTISGVPDADFRISELGAVSVPEPTSLAILGLGLLGFAASRKKA